MKIKGIQEFTLIDYPGKLACTLFLFGCNFKCGFCHNPELVLSPVGKDYTEEEILKFLEKRKGQLDGICITGGEPLMTIDIDFLKKIKDLGYSIKIDTNGSFPELLEELIKKGLIDYVAMDIKSSRDKYQEITNSEIDAKKIEQSIKIISSLLDYYEFRTTILDDFHDVKEIEDMAKWLKKLCKKKPKKFALQGFKNQGKFIDDSFNKKKDTKEEYLKELKEILDEYFDEIEVRI
jgi:pyruvate formate lyase activating enzyme